MLYRILFAALIAMSASVTSAAPVLDAGDALEARMAKLEATVNELEEHGIKEEEVTEQYYVHPKALSLCIADKKVVSFSDFKACIEKFSSP